MRKRLVVLLMILAVPLMGSECHVAARVGGPPPPPPDDVDPRPPGGGGGVIIVTSSAPVAAPAAVEARPLDRALVASALAASVWTPPESRPAALVAVRPGSATRVPVTQSFDDVQLRLAGSAGSFAVPEPTGALLFACGLWLASNRARARARVVGEGSR